MRYESIEIWDAMKQVKYNRTLEDLKKVIRGAQGSMNEAISAVLSMVCSAMHAEAGTFWFYSRFGDGLIHPRARYGGGEIGSYFLLPGEGIAGQVIESGQPAMVADCQKDIRWAAKVDQSTGFMTRSMVCVPLCADGSGFGCIQLINKTDGTLFDEKDLKFVAMLAEEIAEQFVTFNLLADGRVESRVAVLFADIRGFTAMSEDRDPAQLAEILNAYLSYVTGYIRDHSGTADKYIGDCVLAYWIASEEQPDPAYQACLAAWDMMQNAHRMQKKLLEQYGCKLQFGIGISYGQAYVGNIGTSVLTDHTVIGQTVNTAAQLEANAPGGKIYISAPVAQALGKRAGVSSVSAFRLKGRNKEKVYSLESIKNI